ncbi:MAG: hypothetical protein V3U44_05525, partial [Alphaproteobacteria bacterium]
TRDALQLGTKVFDRSTEGLGALARGTRGLTEGGRLATLGAGTARMLEGGSRTAEFLGNVGRVSESAFIVAEGLGSAGRTFVNTSRIGRMVNESLPRFLDRAARRVLPKVLYDPDMNAAMRVGEAIQESNRLLVRGSTATGEEAENLAARFAGLQGEIAADVIKNPRSLDMLHSSWRQQAINTTNLRLNPAGVRAAVDSSGDVGRAAARIGAVQRDLLPPARSATLAEAGLDAAAQRLNQVRRGVARDAIARNLESFTPPVSARPEAVADDLARGLAEAGIPEGVVSRAADDVLDTLGQSRRNLTQRVNEVEQGLARGFHDEEAAGRYLEQTRARLERLRTRETMLANLRDNPAPRRATVEPLGDATAVVPEPRVRRFTPDELLAAREAPTASVPVRQPFINEPLPQVQFRSHTPRIERDSRAAEAAANAIEHDLDAMRRGGAEAGDIARIEGRLDTARRQAAELRASDYTRTLNEAPLDDSGRRLIDRILPGREELTGGAVRFSQPHELAIANNPGIRTAVAEFFDDTPDWARMARTLPDENPELAGRLMAFREWVWDQTAKRFDFVRRTGSRGRMTNDLDFSIASDTPGAHQLAVERFLANEIKIGPNRTGLGPNWERKLNSAAFSDPRIMHVYDRLPRSGDVARVRHGLFDHVEGAELDALRRSMPEDAWRNLTREMGIDGDAIISAAPRDPRPREELLHALDNALADLRRADYADPELADRVVRLQVDVNRLAEDAYLSPGAVKQTVTYTEGLVDFDRPLQAVRRNGEIALTGRAASDAPRGLTIDLPSGRFSDRSFTNMRELRRAMDELAALPPTPLNQADRLILQRTINLMDENLMGVDAVERYQNILGNMNFFEHQLEQVGGDALSALRRYQSSKYLDRIYREAFNLDVDTRAYSILGEAKRMAGEFYRVRDGAITRYFSSQGAELTAAEARALETRAANIIEELRGLNATIAGRARREATQTMALETRYPFVDAADNPARFIRQTYGPEGAQASRAYQIAAEELGDDVAGIVGSFARGEARLYPWPETIGTFEDAFAVTKMPSNLPDSILANLPERALRFYNMRQQMGRLPSDIDVISTVTDVERLRAVQNRIFDETGVMVEFVEPNEALSVLRTASRSDLPPPPRGAATASPRGPPPAGEGTRTVTTGPDTITITRGPDDLPPMGGVAAPRPTPGPGPGSTTATTGVETLTTTTGTGART